LPIEKAVCVLSCQSLFRHFSGLPLANFGDESLPSWGICDSGDEIISQDFQLSIREQRFAVIAWIKPGRLGTCLLS